MPLSVASRVASAISLRAPVILEGLKGCVIAGVVVGVRTDRAQKLQHVAKRLVRNRNRCRRSSVIWDKPKEGLLIFNHASPTAARRSRRCGLSRRCAPAPLPDEQASQQPRHHPAKSPGFQHRRNTGISPIAPPFDLSHVDRQIAGHRQEHVEISRFAKDPAAPAHVLRQRTIATAVSKDRAE